MEPVADSKSVTRIAYGLKSIEFHASEAAQRQGSYFQARAQRYGSLPQTQAANPMIFVPRSSVSNCEPVVNVSSEPIPPDTFATGGPSFSFASHDFW
jgi:hypothetical protein